MYLTQTQCYYRNQKSIISLALDWIIKKFTYIIITVPVAQWIARWTSNPKVPGSNPGRDANNNFWPFCFSICISIFWNNVAILFIKPID